MTENDLRSERNHYAKLLDKIKTMADNDDIEAIKDLLSKESITIDVGDIINSIKRFKPKILTCNPEKPATIDDYKAIMENKHV